MVLSSSINILAWISYDSDYVITVYFSLMLLNPSDVVTLMHGSIIITGILSRIFLKEKLTIAHLIGLMLTVMGVIFISKPSVLFSNEVGAQNHSDQTQVAIKKVSIDEIAAFQIFDSKGKITLSWVTIKFSSSRIVA